MSNVIDFYEWKARRMGKGRNPTRRAAGRTTGGNRPSNYDLAQLMEILRE